MIEACKKMCGKLRGWSGSEYLLSRFFRQTAAPAAIDSHLVYNTQCFPFADYGFFESDKKVSDSFHRYSSYEQRGYVCNVRHTTFIEPIFGFVVTENDEYLKESIPYSNDNLIPPPFVPDRWHGGKKICLSEAISIRYGWNNYWHFYNDAIGTLVFLHSLGISKDIPIVVPEETLQNGYVREVLKNHAYFKNLNFIFQK